GLAYTQRMGAHIRVEFLTLRLSPRVRAILDIAASVLGLLLYSIVTYQSFIWAWDSWQVGDYVSGLINIPRWPSQFVVPLGAALLCLQFLADVAQRVAELKPPRALDGPRREE
ncbi:MAG TPA: TRAP transporter small permease, partial [Candidatus Entotheonella sp.]